MVVSLGEVVLCVVNVAGRCCSTSPALDSLTREAPKGWENRPGFLREPGEGALHQARRRLLLRQAAPAGRRTARSRRIARAPADRRRGAARARAAARQWLPGPAPRASIAGYRRSSCHAGWKSLRSSRSFWRASKSRDFTVFSCRSRIQRDLPVAAVGKVAQRDHDAMLEAHGHERHVARGRRAARPERGAPGRPRSRPGSSSSSSRGSSRAIAAQRIERLVDRDAVDPAEELVLRVIVVQPFRDLQERRSGSRRPHRPRCQARGMPRCRWGAGSAPSGPRAPGGRRFGSAPPVFRPGP